MSRRAPEWPAALKELGRRRRTADPGRLVDQVRSWPERVRLWLDGPNTVAHCPVDDWDFSPYFTDGRCPLCGYRPPGHMPTPQSRRIDWFWPLAGAMVAISIVMGVLVLVAYNR